MNVTVNAKTIVTADGNKTEKNITVSGKNLKLDYELLLPMNVYNLSLIQITQIIFISLFIFQLLKEGHPSAKTGFKGPSIYNIAIQK